MLQKISKGRTAGILLVLTGTGHLVPSLMMTFRSWTALLFKGWWNEIPPPWDRHELILQKLFWVVWGSFAIPLIVLGALIIWLSQHQIKIPRWTGAGLLLYAFLTFTLMPVGGMLLVAGAGVLLLMNNTKN